ncbi:hypothetical protein BpHYR1_041544 [Brachionus plicatilis]|uniref:Uncharacterized protein n=1 Tax=Brachionus plicatilis TaxID=10195 RepID=A0A3M7QHA4_BRAPC|nr:hypothetical protein BpHYR1_041544 [Brachionus plicatilis]
MNNAILNRRPKDPEVVSPMIRKENCTKKLIGRTLEFDINEQKVVTSTVIEKKCDYAEKSVSFSFSPDFTSTPTYKIQKTSTPKSNELMIKNEKKIQRKNKCKDRCKCYCNSTFKEDVNVSLVFFGTKFDRYDKKDFLSQEKFYRKVKTVKKTTYVTRMKEEYFQNVFFEKNKNFNYFYSNKCPRSRSEQTNFRFNTYDLYYSEENMQEVKMKFYKKYLKKNKRMKRLSKYGDLIPRDRAEFFRF